MRALRHPRREGKDEISEIQFLAAVGAIGELVQVHIVDRGAGSLAELTPTLVRVGWSLLESKFEPYPAGRTPLRAVGDAAAAG